MRRTYSTCLLTAVLTALLPALLTTAVFASPQQSPTLEGRTLESHDHEVPAGLHGEQPVWITLGEDVYGDLVREPGILGPATILKAYANENDVVMTRVAASSLPALSEFLHEKVNRCPGFILHETRADAVAAMEAADRVSLKNAPPFELAIDQQSTVEALLPMLSEANVLATITHLSTEYVNRYYAHPSGEESALWIRDLWAGYAGDRLGVDVTVEAYDHIDYDQPSVILTITGSTYPEQIVVLGGHLDSIRSGGTNTTTSAPGADDNASGIASLSEVIRVLMEADHVPERTVKFMGYAAEEVGLLGSGDIAAEHLAEGAKVAGVLQLDMTAYNGSAEDVALVGDFTSSELNAFVGNLLDTYQPEVTWTTSNCGYGCSDHASWHNRGFAASMPHEARVNQNNPTIHSGNDDLATIGNSAAHALKFTKLGLSFAVEVGNGGSAQPAPQPLLIPDQIEFLNGGADEAFYFMIDVPAGATDFVVTTTGVNGNANLFVSYGCLPTLTHADCSGLSSNSSETCTFANPQEGLYYVMVHSFSGFTGLVLEATYTEQGPDIFEDGFESGNATNWSSSIPLVP